MTRVFANPGVIARSWYPAIRSRAVRPGAVRACALGQRRVAIWRDRQGRAHALDARCPHLGADLTQGRVEADGLRCAFHGWTFDAGGRCRRAPGFAEAPDRCARSYPVQERWGVVWMFNGPEALFDLPAPVVARDWRVITLPPQRVRCHPHVVLANGLDISHYESLHGMRFAEPATCDVDPPFHVSVGLRGRPVSSWWRTISGTRACDIVARFTTVGASLAWVTVTAPVACHVLFSGRPDADGRCLTQTFCFLPGRPGIRWLRAAGLFAALLHDDRRILDRIEFRPAFAETDTALRAFAGVVDALGAW